MKVQILTFGIVQEIIQSTEIEIENGISIAQLRDKLEKDFDGLQQIHFRFAINKKLATELEIIQEGDELALMPPFSGG